MRYRELGSSGLNVSEACLGTMTFGEQNSEADAHRQLDYAVERGVNFIDTAEMYPVPPRGETSGRTESYIGRWLGRSRRRDKLIIATKVTGPARGFAWIRGGPRVVRRHIAEAVDASLRRLGTDYIDLYQIHWPDRNVPMFGGTSFDPAQEREAEPILEQLMALADFVSAGKIRCLGLSNETPWGLASFLRAADEGGLPKVVSVQNAYNLVNRVYEMGLAEVCYREGVAMLPYSPLAFGLLSGKYHDGDGQGRLSLFPGFGPRYQGVNVRAAVAEYVAIARRHGLSPATLALAWLKDRVAVVSVILGATNLDQLAENIDAFGVDVSEEARQEIEAVHAKYPNPAP